MAICMHVDAYVFTCRIAFMKHVFPKFASPGQRPVQQAWPDELRKLCMHIHAGTSLYNIYACLRFTSLSKPLVWTPQHVDASTYCNTQCSHGKQGSLVHNFLKFLTNAHPNADGNSI